MPLPLIVLGIIEIAGYAITAYETYNIGKDLYDDISMYSKDVEASKQEVKKMMESLKKEIALNIDEKEEVTFLKSLSAEDKQSEMTKNANGRGTSNDLIKKAVQQKIPFRQVISMVCDKADKMPMLQLRNKKDTPLIDRVPKNKTKALVELLKLSADELADVNIDVYILVRLKQLAASLIFEFMDQLLNWKSPLKPEVTYYPSGKGGFDDPLFDSPSTKLLRKGKVALNPFYPPPQNRKGMISADLIITEYRAKPAKLDNIFALIEIKFPNDKIEKKQFDQYEFLNLASGKLKTGRDKMNGFRLSLFRYPEDKSVVNEKKPVNSHRSRNSPNKSQ